MNDNVRFITTSIFAIAGLIAAFWVPFLYQEKKEIEYEITSGRLLPVITDSNDEQLGLFYSNEKIENAGIFIIKIKNTGNSPIRSKDYESDIELEFNKKTKIINAKTEKTDPSNLKIEIKFTERKINILPTLLNTDESFSVQAIISTDEYSDPVISARIAGLNKIIQTGTKEARILRDIMFASIGLLSSFFYLYFAMITFRGRYNFTITRKFSGLTAVCLLFGSVTLVARLSSHVPHEYRYWPLVALIPMFASYPIFIKFKSRRLRKATLTKQSESAPTTLSLMITIAYLRGQNLTATPNQIAERTGISPVEILENLNEMHNEKLVTYNSGGEVPDINTDFFLCEGGIQLLESAKQSDS